MLIHFQRLLVNFLLVKFDLIGLWQSVKSINHFLTTFHCNSKLPAVFINIDDPALEQRLPVGAIWGVVYIHTNPILLQHDKSITNASDCHNLCWVYAVRVTEVRLLCVKKHVQQGRSRVSPNVSCHKHVGVPWAESK